MQLAEVDLGRLFDNVKSARAAGLSENNNLAATSRLFVQLGQASLTLVETSLMPSVPAASRLAPYKPVSWGHI